VVGSGPAGVAAAAALAARGVAPLVLDAGRRLEPERALAAEQWAEAADVWRSPLVAELRSAFPVDIDRLLLKPAYGSLYPYASDGVRAIGAAVATSLAAGGFSTAWGGAMLPYGPGQLDGWPVAAEELGEHYRAVLRFVPLAGERDELEREFPLYLDSPGRIPPTPQIRAQLDDLARTRDELRALGVRGGRSRLAVRADVCTRVALCMYGCPFGAIYSSAQTLEQLVSDGRVRYRAGAVVERLEESGGSVRLCLRDGEEVTAERAFVACGAVATTRLLLASLELFDHDVRLADSAYFTVPVLRRRRAGPVAPQTAGNTLAQVFLELDGVHLQLYGFNDLMLRAAAARFRLPERVALRGLQPLLGRLLYLQGYLHSSASPGILARLVREGTDSILELRGAGESAEPAVRAVLRTLRSARRPLGFDVVSRSLAVWPPGKGFHIGGSFPMRERPGELETDVLGRPNGFERVHLVDASVFPTVPPTTITLSIMANAHRIATLAGDA